MSRYTRLKRTGFGKDDERDTYLFSTSDRTPREGMGTAQSTFPASSNSLRVTSPGDVQRQPSDSPRASSVGERIEWSNGTSTGYQNGIVNGSEAWHGASATNGPRLSVSERAQDTAPTHNGGSANTGPSKSTQQRAETGQWPASLQHEGSYRQDKDRTTKGQRGLPVEKPSEQGALGVPKTPSMWEENGRSAAPPALQRSGSLSETRVNGAATATDQSGHLGAALKRNSSVKEIQGWVAQRTPSMRVSGQYPAPEADKSSGLKSDNKAPWEEFRLQHNSLEVDSLQKPQSMRDDDLSYGSSERKGGGYVARESRGNANGAPRSFKFQKAVSMREGGAHSDQIMQMALAYTEREGIPHAVLECAACGRSLAVIVQGNPGIETSFCQTCRPVALGSSSNTREPKRKNKGLVQYCRKILHLGRKPNHQRL